MNSRLDISYPSQWRNWWYWAPLVGLVALYLPTFIGASGKIWGSDENGHGPIVVMVLAWMFWEARGVLSTMDHRPANLTGSVVLGLGLVAYIIGRSQAIWLLDLGSLMLVVLGLLLLVWGWAAVRKLWFPVFFIAFLVPLPGPLVDALTGPLKQMISSAAEWILYGLGYPIARVGVVLSIGQYQLLVADACSGLHSIFSLSALGTLYLYLCGHASKIRNAVIVACIIPVAIAANLVRVIFLVLITYYFGDEAGQGFLHGFAGMVLFVVALLLLLGIDFVWGAAIRLVHGNDSGKQTGEVSP